MQQRSFVLVPGAGGNAGFWQLVEPLLKRAGHDSMAVALPNWPGATFSDHADAIVATATAGTPQEVTLVAQSMGGFAAPLTCDRLPVSELVLLNAMIPAPGETAGEWWGNTGQAEAMRSNDLRDGRDPDAGFDAQTYFLHDLPPDVLASLSDEEEPADSLLQTRFPLTRWPDVPTTVLAGRDDRFFPYEFQRQVARDRLGLEVEQLPGGHLLALSQPEALAARLMRDL